MQTYLLLHTKAEFPVESRAQKSRHEKLQNDGHKEL